MRLAGLVLFGILALSIITVIFNQQAQALSAPTWNNLGTISVTHTTNMPIDKIYLNSAATKAYIIDGGSGIIRQRAYNVSANTLASEVTNSAVFTDAVVAGEVETDGLLYVAGFNGTSLYIAKLNVDTLAVSDTFSVGSVTDGRVLSLHNSKDRIYIGVDCGAAGAGLCAVHDFNIFSVNKNFTGGTGNSVIYNGGVGDFPDFMDFAIYEQGGQDVAYGFLSADDLHKFRWVYNTGSLTVTQIVASAAVNTVLATPISDRVIIDVGLATTDGGLYEMTVDSGLTTTQRIVYSSANGVPSCCVQTFDLNTSSRTFKSIPITFEDSSTPTFAISYVPATGISSRDGGPLLVNTVTTSPVAINYKGDVRVARIDISSTKYLYVHSATAYGASTYTIESIVNGNAITSDIYKESVSVPLVLDDVTDRTNTVWDNNVIRLACNALYNVSHSYIVTGTDSDCTSWKVVATSAATVGRVIPFNRTAELIHANPLTAYTIHVTTTSSADLGVKMKYTGKLVDTNILDVGNSAQLRLLYGNCYELTVYDIATNVTSLEKTICGDDTNPKEISINEAGSLLGFPFWSTPWGVYHKYNETTHDLNLLVHHEPAPFDLTMLLYNKTNHLLINSTITSNFTLSNTSQNVSSYLAGKPLKLEVYTNAGKRIYQVYLDGRPAYLKPVADMFQDMNFAGWNVLFFAPLIFGAIFTRNTAGVGIMATVGFIMVANWFGIIELPDPAIWLIAIAGIIGVIAFRNQFGD